MIFKEVKEKKRLIIIDGNAIIHRAYHALPPLTTKKGELVNAIYGFLLFFFKAIKEFKPDYIAATFDYPAPTFRHKEYKLYKATRPKAPVELYSQIPKVKEVLKNFAIPVFEKEGYEADDLIGAISYLAESKNPEIETIILTADTDILQLVDENTKVYALKRGVKEAVLYDEAKTKEKYEGLSPSQLIDFRSLKGDPTDNIPGVLGIGEKTAIELIKEFGSIENLYKEIEENTEKAKKIKKAVKEKLIKNKENAFISKMLSKIETKMPFEFSLEKCQWGKYDEEKAREILKNYEFSSLISRLKELENKNNPAQKEKKISRKNNNNLRLL
jgi:DNA polymerase-1